jgi:hypothetical protein
MEEVFKLKKHHNEYPKGSMGIFEDIIPDGRMSLIMDFKCGIKHCILIDQTKVEPAGARVDSKTGKIITNGYCVNDGDKYFESYDDAFDYISEQGYRSMKDAYEDGYYYWTDWDDSFTFPDDLPVFDHEIVKP